jgi:glyoxylase-like metal-dependent hydrolase (beta-lactamase superfamily II)
LLFSYGFTASPNTTAELKTYLHVNGVKGLSSVTTLIVGQQQAAIIDPPFFLEDALDVVKFIKEKTDVPLAACFVTHHHPDHWYSANAILEAFPLAKFYASPYVRAAIDREYDDKLKYWLEELPKGSIPQHPQRPQDYPWSFFVLTGSENSAVMLLGPVQGDAVDHTLFWLPREKTIICGDTVYARSTHLW